MLEELTAPRQRSFFEDTRQEKDVGEEPAG